VKRVWNTEYKPKNVAPPPPPPPTSTNDFWMELNAEFAADSAAIDEYQHYCDTPTVETIEAISW